MQVFVIDDYVDRAQLELGTPRKNSNWTWL